MKMWWRRKQRSRSAVLQPTTATTTDANNSDNNLMRAVVAVNDYSGHSSSSSDGRSSSLPPSTSRRSASSSSRRHQQRRRIRRIFRVRRRQGDGNGPAQYTITVDNEGDVEEGEMARLDQSGLMIEVFLQSILSRSDRGNNRTRTSNNNSTNNSNSNNTSLWGRRRNRNVHLFGTYMEDIDTMSYERLLELFGDGSENKGADEWSIRALPCSVIQDVEKDLTYNTRQCMICLEDFEDGDKRKSLPCMHGFHVDCCDKWLKINGCCPICKCSIKV
uniref:RING-type domain-containing protein n=1 Tax=Ditylum brightwellii TaxID=49249 RepID=A0A7S4RFY9_9STRA|mmetsp:Transcript_34917/g.52737  ORF Transcript_34917/g.52737 Transcript_34917/m.52737 type:complete len:274 (+) Transcript_34917:384-1205(+)